MTLTEFYKAVAKVLFAINKGLPKDQETTTFNFSIDKPFEAKSALFRLIAKVIEEELKADITNFSIRYSDSSMQVKFQFDKKAFCKICLKKAVEFEKKPTVSLSWSLEARKNQLSAPCDPWLESVMGKLAEGHLALSTLQFENNTIKYIPNITEDYQPLKKLFNVLGVNVNAFPLHMIRQYTLLTRNPDLIKLTKQHGDQTFLQKLEDHMLTDKNNESCLKLMLMLKQYSDLMREDFHLHQCNVDMNDSWLRQHCLMIGKMDLHVAQSLVSLVRISMKSVDTIEHSDLDKVMLCLSNLIETCSDKNKINENVYTKFLIARNVLIRISRLLLRKFESIDPNYKIYPVIDSILNLIKTIAKNTTHNEPLITSKNSLIYIAIDTAKKQSDVVRLDYYTNMMIQNFTLLKGKQFIPDNFQAITIRVFSYHVQGNIHGMLSAWHDFRVYTDNFLSFLNEGVGQKDFIMNLSLYYSCIKNFLEATLSLVNVLKHEKRHLESYKICEKILSDYNEEKVIQNIVNIKFKSKKDQSIASEFNDNLTSATLNAYVKTCPEIIGVIGLCGLKPDKNIELTNLQPKLEKLNQYLLEMKALLHQDFYHQLDLKHCKKLGFNIQLNKVSSDLEISCENHFEKFKKALRNNKFKFKITNNTLVLDKLIEHSPARLIRCISNVFNEIKTIDNNNIKNDTENTTINTNSIFNIIYKYNSNCTTTSKAKHAKPRQQPQKNIMVKSTRHDVLDSQHFSVDFSNGLKFSSEDTRTSSVVALFNDHHYQLGTYFAVIDDKLKERPCFEKINSTLRNRGVNSGLIAGPKGQKGVKLYTKPNGEEVFKIKIMKNTFALGYICNAKKPAMYNYGGLNRKAFLIKFDTVSTHEKEKRHTVSISL